MSNQKENNTYTASNRELNYSITKESVAKAIAEIKSYPPPLPTFKEAYICGVDFAQFEKDKNIKNICKKSDYFGCEITVSEFVPRYHIVFNDRKQFYILDCTPKYLKVINNIKKTFFKIKFNIEKFNKYIKRSYTNE